MVQYFKKFFNNDFGSTFINKVVSILLGIIASTMVTRYMGPEIKGLYTYIINFVSVAATILNLGIYQSYPYNKRNGPEDVRDKFLNIYIVQFLIYLVISIVGFTLMDDQGYALAFLLLPLSVLTHQISFLMLIEDIKFRNFIHITNSVVNVFLSAGLFYFAEQNVVYVLAIVVIKDLILILPFIIRIRSFPNPLKCDFKLFAGVVKFGIYPMMTSLLITANYRIDVLLLKEMVPLAQLGLYSIGVGLAEYAWIVPDVFKEVLLSKTAKRDSIESIKFALRVSLFIVIFIIIGVIFFGKQLLFILYGAAFVPAYQVTIFLFAGIPSMIFFKVIGTLFLAQGRKKFYFYSLLISVFFNVLLNLLLIPKFGICGSAFASMVSYSICGVAFLIRFLTLYKINPLEVLLIRKADFIAPFKSLLSR